MRIICIGFVCCLFSIASFAQVVLYVDAGSRAPWGNREELLVNKNGKVLYYLVNEKGDIVDSAITNITLQQITSFFQQASQNGFFKLDSIYDGGVADGSGIYMSMNDNGSMHHVSVLNTNVPAVTELLTLLKSMLEPKNIRIRYQP